MGYILIIIAAILVNNIVFSQFLGICPFLGVSKTLITTNCAVLGVAINVATQNFNAYGLDYNLLTGTVFALATSVGYGVALVLFTGLREQLKLADIPKGMQGTPIAILTAGLLAMAFMGFSGVV